MLTHTRTNFLGVLHPVQLQLSLEGRDCLAHGTAEANA